MDFARRVKSLRNSMVQKDYDVLLLTEVSNVLYLTGFKGGLFLLPVELDPILLVNPLEYSGAIEGVVGCRVERLHMGETVINATASQLSQLGAGKISYDSLNAQGYLFLSSKLGITLQGQGSDLLWALRRVKDEEEVTMIKEASRLAIHGMAAADEVIAAGVTELKVAAEAEYAMRSSGSEGTAFETLVSSGVRAAIPHATASDKMIQKGELVIVDLGATVGGYRSDLTRTFQTGTPSEEQFRVATTVLEAQRAAKAIVKEGVSCGEADAKSRAIIEKAGFVEAFVHSLGHGVGLDVHEPPRLGPSSSDALIEGNVVTVEPGIYIRGFGGYRNEDLILIRRNGFESLTEAAPVAFPEP